MTRTFPKRVLFWLAVVVAAVVGWGTFVFIAVNAHGATTHHSITGTVKGSGRYASVEIKDRYAHGKLTKVVYTLEDLYRKVVIIPNGGAEVYAEDIAECGTLGQVYPDNGYVGSGLPCHPHLHSTETRYHQTVGSLSGRFADRRKLRTVTEVAQGHGKYLTVGHIDHGALIEVEYYWANGENLTVHLPPVALVNHVELYVGADAHGHLSAVEERHTSP